MADSRRGAFEVAAGAAERDSRAEALLVEGLDQYFSGHYEEAVHLWTRVLFLDRSHARARAYIDRARTALSERQRRAEEMVHTAGELLTEGRIEQARRLLARAEATAGADEQAAELRARIERVERSRVGSVPVAHPAAIVDAVPLRRAGGRARFAVRLAAGVAFGVFLVTAARSPAVRDWFIAAATMPAPHPVVAQPIPVLTSGEAALIRARTLYARGRLAEALQTLRHADGSGVARADTDALRAEIQHWLLMPRIAPDATPSAASGGQP
jgi:hypothetical protein